MGKIIARDKLLQEAEALVDNILAAKAYIKAAALYGADNPQQVEFCLKAAWDRVGIVAQEGWDSTGMPFYNGKLLSSQKHGRLDLTSIREARWDGARLAPILKLRVTHEPY